jgi:antitoxin HicB
MEMARCDATMPRVRKRPLGNQDSSIDETDRASADLFWLRTPRRITWVCKEDAGDTKRRHGIGAQAPKGVGGMNKRHMGSSIDDFLKEEGIFEEAQAQAVKEVVAWQLAEAMKKKKISKARMAALLKTSRTQVDRLLDPKRDITLSSLQRAAAMVGRRVSVELV